MERTATHDGEYVDIVLGYQHILAFSLVFGALIFGTGYFVGYYRARTEQPAQRVSETTAPQSAPRVTPTSAQLPAIIPTAPPPGDVVKDMDDAARTDELNAPASGIPETTPAAAAQTSAAREPEEEPKASVVPPVTAPEKPAKKEPAPRSDSKKRAGPQAKADPKPEADSLRLPKIANAKGGIYLQTASFGDAKDAQSLINNLASDGVRALVDKQLVGGKHTVLVGPFSDFKTAMGKAKELKGQNLDAFPIRR